ncbi:MAG: DNA mismatch repair protein MutS [Oscillospiraceae bacterium]|uniref:lysine 5,6-aminomutase reactivase ATPase KamC n=1 Tax=unclassified Intestinimonas TaxID=2685768 RepID=UPI001DF1E716|nr:DNA mismatch repair protein MutS [Intestinimonas sp. UBA1698]MBS6283757.1 DNA mismatch repair protein MutS [Oscillospiraceae bacterium]
MVKLDQQLKEDTGYLWVMARLEPASPFGRALARTPRWYGPGEEGALEAELGRVDALLAWMEQGAPAVENVVHLLSEFHDIKNSFQRPSNSPMDEVELFEVKHFLLYLERLAEEYGRFPRLEGLELRPMTGLLDLLDPSGRRLPPFSVENAFDPALERIRADKLQVERELRSAEGEAREALLARRRELVLEEDKAELAARRRLTAALLREKAGFFAAMDAIGRLDLTLAKARLARRFGCVRPRLSAVPEVEAFDMVHPEVADHLKERGGAFTPVSITLEKGTTVITGANMGGKSVSLKSVTLNLLLLQTGFFVFAREMTAPLFDSVSLICTDRQSVEQGLSSFGAEVAALGDLLRREKGKFFFVALDEFARGTNPREGAALARALVEYLGGLNCVAMMTTHYDGVSDAARRHYQVAGLAALDTAAFRAGEAPLDRLSRLMDYRLLAAPPGAPCPRDALRVCRLLDLDEEWMKIFEENS